MTAEVRASVEADRDQVIDVLRTSLSFPRRWIETRGSTLPLDRFRGSFVDGKLVGTAGEFDFRQWFPGRDLPCP